MANRTYKRTIAVPYPLLLSLQRKFPGWSKNAIVEHALKKYCELAPTPEPKPTTDNLQWSPDMLFNKALECGHAIWDGNTEDDAKHMRDRLMRARHHNEFYADVRVELKGKTLHLYHKSDQTIYGAQQ